MTIDIIDVDIYHFNIKEIIMKETEQVGLRLNKELVNSLRKLADKKNKDRGGNSSYLDLIRHAILEYYNEDFNKLAFESDIKAFSYLKQEIKEKCKKIFVDNSKIMESHEGRLAFSLKIKSIIKEIVERETIDFLQPTEQSCSPIEVAMKEDFVCIPKHSVQKFKINVEQSGANDSFIVPTFEIANHPTVKLSVLKSDLDVFIDEIVEKYLYSICILISTLEKLFFQAAIVAAKNSDKVVNTKIVNTKEYKYSGEALRVELSHFKNVKNKCLVMNAKTFNNYIKPDGVNIIEEYRSVIPYTTLEQLNVYILNTSPDNKIFIVGNTKDKLVCVDRQPITVLLADDPMTLCLGWVIYREIGLAFDESLVGYVNIH